MHRHVLVIYSLTMVALLTLLLVYYAMRGGGFSLQASTSMEQYAVIIDAGSSGSRVHVFRYAAFSQEGMYPEVQLPDEQFKVTPGLSDYATALEGAAASISSLVEFALSKVPEQQHASTPVHLLATAGLRMLPQQDSDAVLDAVKGVLGKSGFIFKPEWARILPGDLEGLYAWAAFNFASGTLQLLAVNSTGQGRKPTAFTPPVAQTWGVLELGGASLQVTFLPDPKSLLPDYAKYLDLPGLGKSVPLFTHSFLGYGANVALVRAASMVQLREDKHDPCLPRGFQTESGITGSGDFQECRQLASQLLPIKACRYDSCSINGQYMPQLAGIFLGTENFFYTAQRLGMHVGPVPGSLDSGARSAVATNVSSGSSENKNGGRRLIQSVQEAATPSQHVRAVQERGGPAKRGPSNTRQQLSGSPRKRLATGSTDRATASLAELGAAGESFCALPWEKLKQEFITEQKIPQEYVMRVCFSAAYAWALLHDAFHIEETEQRVVFSNSVQVPPDGQAQEVNWVLGALLLEVIMSASTPQHIASLPSVHQVHWARQHLGLVLGVGGLLAVAAAVAWMMTSPVRGPGDIEDGMPLEVHASARNGELVMVTLSAVSPKNSITRVEL